MAFALFLKEQDKASSSSFMAINFLGYTAEEVFKLSAKLNLLEMDLGPVSIRFVNTSEQLVIKECHITPNHKRTQ
jgi:hypothetical protein